MKSYKLAFFLCALPFALPAMAETVTCPDLATAVQVGTCPSEEELQFTFGGYCSDNARMYNWQEEQVCTDYRLYRRLKNVALWEAQGGKFQGYVSCDLSADKIKSARLSSIAATRKGKLARVACTYSDDIVFTYRTKGQCRVEGSGDCAGNPDACKATCD
jgi:hypothetical protein